jgi:cytosine/adenosine deaminase-related metal-dependent hydrolase
MLLRARLVLPISRPPLEDGAVRIVGHRIAALCRWQDVPAADRQDVCDLGECILLPGLINAHCHLDYTRMAGLIAPPKQFADWIKAMVALKAEWSYTEFSASWVAGAAMLVRNGVTTVADIEAVPELLPEVWTATPLRVISFRELIHFKEPARAGEVVDAAVREWSALPDCHLRAGLSPHAPYTTSRELLRLAARAARRRMWRLTTHVAESEAEYQMFMYRQGPLFEWLKDQRDLSDCGHGSPVQHLAQCDYLDQDVIAGPRQLPRAGRRGTAGA